MVVQLLAARKAQILKQTIQVYVFGIDLESKFGHHHLEFVLEFLVLLGILMEVPLEDGMDKDLIPRQSILLMMLKALLQEVDGFLPQHWIDQQRLGFDVFDEFEFGVCSPGSPSVQHLEEDEASGPDIALRGIGL
jgi:hypothetical protein